MASVKGRVLFVFLLLFFSTSSASGLIHPLAISVMLILLLFSTALIGLAYMVGNVLGIEKLNVWAKHEIGEVVAAALIFTLISFFTTSADKVAEAAVQIIDKPAHTTFCTTSSPPPYKFTVNGKDIDPGYDDLPCHMRVADNYLTSIFYETASLFKSIGLAYSTLSYISTFSYSSTFQGAGKFLSAALTTTNFFLGFAKTKVNFYSFMFRYLTRLLIIIRFQEIILRFIAVALFPILLSLGIGLRAFFLTRKLGGLLIAMALSLYYIYPLFFVIGDAVYYNVAYLHSYSGTQHPNPAVNPVLAKTTISDDLMAIPGLNAKMNETGGKIVVEKDANLLKDQATLTTDITETKKLSEKEQEKLSGASNICSGIATEWNDIENVEKDFPENLMNRYFTELMDKHVGNMNIFVSGFKQNLYALDLLARLMFFSTFFSFMAVITTIANIKVFSPILGGDVEIAGLTRLI